MYAAKAEGRNAVAVYADRRSTPRPATLELEGQMHAALDHDELEVFYQPQYDLGRGSIVAAEALVRWRHPLYGMLEPSTFIGVAEESGLLPALDQVVRRQAFAQTRAWHDAGHPLRIAVNLGGHDLRNPSFPGRLVDEVAMAGIDPGDVELEITERVVIEDKPLRRALDAFARAGFRVAIDDFGTGSSVLRRLHKIRVHTLKIDRSLIQDVQDDTASLVVKAMLALAQSMRLETVVEGVENVHQLNALRGYGADLAQGFLLSRPVPATAMNLLLETTNSVTASLLRAAPQPGFPRPRRGTPPQAAGS
jgi:EAL domain-containing protein (putative c-di-GMP-specific phosphodiesterase class I)